MVLLACGVASVYERFGRFHRKALGLVSVTLFYLKYPLFWGTYTGMVPSMGDGGATLGAVMFLVVNVLVPVILVTVGPLLPVVGVGRGNLSRETVQI